MFENNYLTGSLRIRDIIRDSWKFYKRNFAALMTISLVAVLGLFIYEAIVLGYAALNIFSEKNIFIIFSSLLMFPIIIICIYLLTVMMVSMIKRINGLFFDEKIGLKQSMKGTPMASIKVLGVSMLGGLVIELPMLALIPFGVGFGIFSGIYFKQIPLEGLFIAGFIVVLIIFFIAFIIWALYVGAHLITIINSIIIDSSSGNWISNTRKLLKGRIKSVIGMILAVYGIMIVLSLPVSLIGFFATLSGGNYFVFTPISLGFSLIVFMFIYPFGITAMLILYHRLKEKYSNDNLDSKELTPVEIKTEQEVG